LLAVTADGALMRKAAFGLAVHAAEMLVEHTGAVSGGRVVLLVGAGNNGGDALWAGLSCASGASPCQRCCSTRTRAS